MAVSGLVALAKKRGALQSDTPEELAPKTKKKKSSEEAAETWEESCWDDGCSAWPADTEWCESWSTQSKGSAASSDPGWATGGKAGKGWGAWDDAWPTEGKGGKDTFGKGGKGWDEAWAFYGKGKGWEKGGTAGKGWDVWGAWDVSDGWDETAALQAKGKGWEKGGKAGKGLDGWGAWGETWSMDGKGGTDWGGKAGKGWDAWYGWGPSGAEGKGDKGGWGKEGKAGKGWEVWDGWDGTVTTDDKSGKRVKDGQADGSWDSSAKPKVKKPRKGVSWDVSFSGTVLEFDAKEWCFLAECAVVSANLGRNVRVSIPEQIGKGAGVKIGSVVIFLLTQESKGTLKPVASKVQVNA